ncbi:MAG: Dabb family protein [Planctomycetota bacterium]
MADFHHTVHFWLQPGLDEDRRADFFASLRGLAESPHVKTCRVGTPAGTDRPVVDNSYDAQLLCVFDSVAAHNAYQSPADEVHADFIERFKDCWAKVVIYDSIDG